MGEILIALLFVVIASIMTCIRFLGLDYLFGGEKERQFVIKLGKIILVISIGVAVFFALFNL